MGGVGPVVSAGAWVRVGSSGVVANCGGWSLSVSGTTATLSSGASSSATTSLPPASDVSGWVHVAASCYSSASLWVNGERATSITGGVDASAVGDDTCGIGTSTHSALHVLQRLPKSRGARSSGSSSVSWLHNPRVWRVPLIDDFMVEPVSPGGGVMRRSCSSGGRWVEDASDASSSVFSAAFPSSHPSCVCPQDGEWPPVSIGVTARIPCGSGFSSRDCTGAGTWGAVDDSKCVSGCPPSNGWPASEPGDTVRIPCPFKQGGMSIRVCNVDGNWLPPDTSSCDTSGGSVSLLDGASIESGGVVTVTP